MWCDVAGQLVNSRMHRVGGNRGSIKDKWPTLHVRIIIIIIVVIVVQGGTKCGDRGIRSLDSEGSHR